MPDFKDEDLTGARFEHVDLSGARFERVNFDGAEIRMSGMTDTRFRDVWLNRVVMRGVELVDLDLYGEIGRLVVNGVEVRPYVEAELDRRHPDRAKMRPEDARGFRLAWDTVERLWDGTVTRARRLEPDLLHESIDGEWSFIETLRHLVFATDAWVRRAVLGDPSPWHPLDLPWDGMEDMPGVVPRDREARPSLDEVLELRRDRMSSVRSVVYGLTDEYLATETEPVHAPGWPEPRAYPVWECLRVVLNEEWEHRLYAERDLAILEERNSDRN